MDLRFLNEMRIRRDEALETARHRRLSRLASRGRSTGLRMRIAKYAEAASDVLAELARRLRNDQAA